MRRYLTEMEQRELLNAAKSSSDPLAQRDFHWMNVLILTGMRIQEFSRLTADQARLSLRVGWLVSRKEHCKGKRRANDYMVTQPLRRHLQALLDLSDDVAGELQAREGGMRASGLRWPAIEGLQLQESAASAPQPLVWGRNVGGVAGPLSVRSYEARLKIWLEVAGLDQRASPHWLRHTRGMNVIRRTRGADGLRVAQRALNHASLSSTGIYVQMAREEFEQSIQMVDGGRVPRRAARQIAERLGA